jgi:hypothetical protein
MVRNSPYYSLNKVRQLASTGKCIINTKARKTARDDFGWSQSDVKKAISKLQVKHFYKSDTKYDNPGVYVDYYKANGLMGENVYIHFRIEDDCLIICSFKEIQK